ncbi:MAG TPA: glycosyltransferase family 39 protein [Chloroflexota bacterium]|nr:glycosyltransferase family 39 protein [Chloroflexota bacterium]
METATVAVPRTRLIRGYGLVADAGAIAGVTFIALLARLSTASLLSSGISTDEYRYSIIGQEWLRILSGSSSMTLRSLVVHHPLVPVIAALASALRGGDLLSSGRSVELFLNLATIPTLYLLARTAGLRMAAALTAALGLAVMPGYWDASASFLPDSQLAFLSTMVFLGAALELRGHRWGAALSAVALGCGFLTKEHLPLVLLPSIAALYAVAIGTRLRSVRDVMTSMLLLIVGLIIAVAIGAFGIGIPRAIVLTVMARTEAPQATTDGLPPAAPTLESDTGSSWITSLSSAIVNRDLSLDWFGSALGIQVLGGAIVVLGLFGACILMAAKAEPDQRALPPRWARLTCLAVPATLFLAQILVSAAVDALLVAALLIAMFVGLSSTRLRIRPLERDWPRTDPTAIDGSVFWALLAGLSVYMLASIGFFALKLEQVSFQSRMFLPIMPACALFFGIGCVGVGRILRPFADRLSATMLITIGGIALGLLLPGGPLRKAGALVAACGLGGALQWSGVGQRLPKTQTIAMLTGLIACVLGTPSLTLLARGREFRGFPDDPYYRNITGGIRVAAFRAAEPWLQSNIRPSDTVITSKPYQLSWHAALGFSGYAISRVWDERAVDRRRYLSDAVLQHGEYDWIADFNQFAIQIESPEGPAFEEDYRWLQSRPYLQEAYTGTDPQGRILLYAFKHVRS